MSHRHDPGSKECREIFSQLSEYLDGELDPGLCDRMQGHLDDCPPCRAFLDSLRRTVRAIRDLDAPTLDEKTRRRLIDEARRLGGS